MNIKRNLKYLSLLLIFISILGCSKKLEHPKEDCILNSDTIYLIKEGMTVQTDEGYVDVEVDSVIIPYEYYMVLQRR